MYDMYPEWGPSRHYSYDSDNDQAGPRTGGLDPVQYGLDLRDNGGERPDDN